jgi:hypothetical protein
VCPRLTDVRFPRFLFSHAGRCRLRWAKSSRVYSPYVSTTTFIHPASESSQPTNPTSRFFQLVPLSRSPPSPPSRPPTRSGPNSTRRASTNTTGSGGCRSTTISVRRFGAVMRICATCVFCVLCLVSFFGLPFFIIRCWCGGLIGICRLVGNRLGTVRRRCS